MSKAKFFINITIQLERKKESEGFIEGTSYEIFEKQFPFGYKLKKIQAVEKWVDDVLAELCMFRAAGKE
jgi:hypothetical protein